MLLIDPGAFTHAAPPSFAPDVALQPITGSLPNIVTADGSSVPCYGFKEVRLLLNSGQKLTVPFIILAIKRPILSVSQLNREGYYVWFGPNPYIQGHDAVISLVSLDGLFYLPVNYNDVVGACDSLSCAYFPVSHMPRSLDAVVSQKEICASWKLFEWCCSSDSRLGKQFASCGQCIMRFGLPQWDVLIAKAQDRGSQGP
jgi:hypothetical protein